MQRVAVRGLVPLLVCTLAIVAAAVPSAAETTKDLLKCQKTIEKETAKLIKQRVKNLGKCVLGLLECTLATEVDGDPLGPCQADAAAKCTEKSLSKAEAAAQKFTDKVVAKCGFIPTLPFRARPGLGFRDSADACAALSPPASTATTAAGLACAVQAAACAGDDRVEQTMPRAYEVLAAAGLEASAPCVDAQAAAAAGAGVSTVKDLIKCLKEIDGKSVVAERTREKTIQKCNEPIFKCDLAFDRVEGTLAERNACRAGAALKCGGKRLGLANKETKRDEKIAAKCGGLAITDVLDRLGFRALCPAAADIDDVVSCVTPELEQRTERILGTVSPRACRLLGAVGELTDFEDVCVPSCGNGVVEGTEACDDGNQESLDECANTCTAGPIERDTFVIASTAAPANTPDGAGIAVPPGTTLETQFGPSFDFNRAIYTRYRVAGAGDPDAVLILIPGFAGGSGSFSVVARNLLTRAVTGGQIVLEVWAYDRRTNFLEDVEGSDLATDALDPLLALDWFFGAEVGLPLDPMLTRRAVFHTGATVPFVANFTRHVFARDVDAVVEAARALPGPPAVFLGGHSLGTSFTAAYAATDFDPGVGVDAGYAKLNGLVLLEGGGGAVPVAPPSSDALDLAIAKADGGLYYAVRDQAPRCVDGTDCSATGDADCAAVALPAGAVTNKCVAPVEAYTGAATTGIVFINPQIQAAGVVTGVQGQIDPQGLVLVQRDFGVGLAVENVPGLGLLVALPAASAEAAAGFFLDDEFSPVAAFRGSFGYSNNGVNSNFLGLVIPQPATSDPYRLWINVDQPQPAAAIPNNGPAVTPGAVWGQEKEVSRLDRFFPSLSSPGTNFGDWYFASSGLSTTTSLDGAGTFGATLDSSALSVSRGRPDIENLTEAGAIDIPVIAFGGSNGLTPTGSSFRAFATSIGTCTAPSCTGATPRLGVDLPVNPLYGGIGGGYEVHLVEGYAHIDVVSSEDNAANTLLGPLHDFLVRNTP
jgi:cysteine-rich repeat protein